MRYIIYCRKSTESEDRQVMSLDAQKTELLEIAIRDNLKVIKIFEESQSAKSLGRPIFAQMIKMITSGKADAILCWKEDRLARNLIDGGQIIDLLQKNIIKEIRTYQGIHLPKDNVLMILVHFGMANQYSRDLAENVKRGNRESLRQGRWPFQVPFGYSRDSSTKQLFPNDKSHWVKRIFELYASGTKSFEDISDMLYEEGLRTKSGGKMFLGSIHRHINNKIYYGIMAKNGEEYLGKFEPIVSKELFDRCQEVINQASRPKQKTLFFPLRGSMRCKECGCMLTASLKRGHRYYYCTNGKGNCEQGKSYMREEYIARLIADKLGDLAFDDEAIEIMYEAAKQKIGLSNNRVEVLSKNVQNELNSIKEKESRLTDGFASGTIRKDLYDEKMLELNNQRVELEAQLGHIKKGNINSALTTLEQTKEVFLQAKNAKNDFLFGEDSERYQILNSVLWNIQFENKEIQEIQYKKPFFRIANTPKNADFSILSAQ